MTMAYGSSRNAPRMQYSYPLLDAKDILRHLASLGIGGLTEENLAKPTADLIFPVYEALALCVGDITREEIMLPVLDATSFLKHEGLYDDGVQTFASIDAIMRLMFAARVSDFSTKDIFKPDPARTCASLSAVINFAMFRQEKEQEVDDIQREVDDWAEEFQKIGEKREQLQKDIELKEVEIQAQQPQVQALEADIKELEHAISNRNKQQAALQNIIKGLKQELNSLTEKIASNRSLVAQMKQEGFQLKAQIVQSPDKLQKTLADKRLALQNAQAAADAARKSVKKWKTNIDSYVKTDKKVCKRRNMLDALEKQSTFLKKITKDIKELKYKSKLLEEEDWALSSEHQELEIEEKHSKDLIDKVKAARTTKCDELDKQIKETKLQSEPIILQRKKKVQEIALKEAQVQNLLKERAEVGAIVEEDLAKFYADAVEVQDQVMKYARKIIDLSKSVPDKEGLETR